MARWLGDVSNRRTATVAVALIIASAAFAGGGIYSVMDRDEQVTGICDAVLGLRRDLVEIVRDGEERSKTNIQRLNQPQEVKDYLITNLEESTNETVAKIENPECP